MRPDFPQKVRRRVPTVRWIKAVTDLLAKLNLSLAERRGPGPRFARTQNFIGPPLFGHPRIVSFNVGRLRLVAPGTAAALPAPKPRAGPCSALACIAIRNFAMGKPVFIVHGKPRGPAGILKFVKETRTEAIKAAQGLLDGGMAFVTIIANGHVYTPEEFALTILDAQD
jgi:hypothetical protein